MCELPVNVKWVHHGGGETLAEVNKILEEKGSKVEFINTSNFESYNDVLDLYKKHSPNYFINLSTTEGLPVSILEALSFGIPILCNRVGSCTESVKEGMGYVFEVDDSPTKIAKKIIELKNTDKLNRNREESRRFWELNFNADLNYLNFAKQLKELFNGFKR